MNSPTRGEKRIVRPAPWECGCDLKSAVTWLNALTEMALDHADPLAAHTIANGAEHFLVAVQRESGVRAQRR